jgi:hypothetical protein
MRVCRLVGALVLTGAVIPALAATLTFEVKGTDAAPWTRIFGSIGIPAAHGAAAQIVVAGSTAQPDGAVTSGNQVLILEGDSPLARSLGFTSKVEPGVAVRQISDIHAPRTQIIWQQSVSVANFGLPPDYQVFAREKWKGVPVLAGRRTAHGSILWMATPPGTTGIERYPYLLQALVDLGLTVPVRTTSLWAFFDSSYRIRADVDYLARRWRKSGIAALHVAAWHNMDPDPAQDEYLKKLIEACHRNAVLVYAWLELPHVSDRFWVDHPEWREKTAIGQDAELDWRKLMNLQNADCRRAVAVQVSQLLERFDWDGANVAELYFESLEGASNPARFTPMNDDVRREFQREAGFDPKSLFDSERKSPEKLRQFLDYRARLATKMQGEWLQILDSVRSQKPYLDLVLTHIDDRFDPGIRDELGADVARSLPLMQAHRSSLLVEDPATIWNLGAERYAKLAEKYKELTGDRSRIAVDINVVERYQDVYPTKKQTGIELFQLIHQAASSFDRVALYFENSLEKQDLALLPAAATTARVEQSSVDELEVDGPQATRVDWQGLVELDGKVWPIQDSQSVLMPPGKHRLRPGIAPAAVTIADFNGDVRSALTNTSSIDLSYTSRSRAIVVLGSPVSSVEIDGAPYWKALKDQLSVLLPAGQHIATFYRRSTN